MTQNKLYRCCNTCKYKVDKSINYYGCTMEDKCYNGFSAYKPNEEMEKQEYLERIENK